MTQSFWLYCIYTALGFGVTQGLRQFPRVRDVIFAILNVALVYGLFYTTEESGWAWMLAYVCFASICFALMAPTSFLSAKLARPLAILFPIAVMIAAKSLPWIHLIGVSYFAFRLSYAAMQLQATIIERPSFWRYISYAFFPLVMSIGPITPFSTYTKSFDTGSLREIPFLNAILRIGLGSAKFLFFAELVFPLTPTQLFNDGFRHGIFDLIVASYAYYVYLYCNFSGFTDMMIGAASLMGIEVAENFDQPFLARNVPEFWNRWHITLAKYMREAVFFPLVKTLSKRFRGKEHYNHILALATLVTFVLTGVWHGFSVNYLLYGLMHAIGMVVCLYYTSWLRLRLGPVRFKKYNSNRAIRLVATILTSAYLTASFYLFFTDLEGVRMIFSNFIWKW